MSLDSNYHALVDGMDVTVEATDAGADTDTGTSGNVIGVPDSATGSASEVSIAQVYAGRCHTPFRLPVVISMGL